MLYTATVVVKDVARLVGDDFRQLCGTYGFAALLLAYGEAGWGRVHPHEQPAAAAEGLLRSVLIVEASMPSAIDALILPMHFKRRPELSATVVFLTTVLSLGTITLTLSILN